MLTALMDGERYSALLAELAKAPMRPKIICGESTSLTAPNRAAVGADREARARGSVR